MSSRRKAYGASKVVGIDVMHSGLDCANSFGADTTFMSPKENAGADPIEHSERVAELIREQHGLETGADIVLECSGAEPCIQT